MTTSPVGGGVRAWRARTGEQMVDAEGEEEMDGGEEEEAEVDDAVMEGFHSTAGGQPTGNTVVVSFRNTR